MRYFTTEVEIDFDDFHDEIIEYIKDVYNVDLLKELPPEKDDIINSIKEFKRYNDGKWEYELKPEIEKLMKE